ncbi:MAG TPA: hypothetical protein VF002_10325 [Gaiellaceae bacterium]
MAPRESNRIKTLAAMFASLALFAAARAHAATPSSACNHRGHEQSRAHLRHPGP